MERFVVGGLGDDAAARHGFKSEFDSSLNHGHHEDALVVVFLLGDFHFPRGSVLEGGLGGLFAPGQQFAVAIAPVGHHPRGEGAGDDIVHVLAEQRRHDLLQFVGEIAGEQLGRVRQAVHHIGDAAVLESFGNHLPAMLDELGGVARIDTGGDHLVEAEQGTGLQHAAKNRLLAHEIRFDLGHEGRFEHPGAVAAGGGGVGLGDFKSIAAGVVLGMHRDQRGHAEAAAVFLAHLGAGAFRRHHDDGDVRSDLYALLDDVEAVGVGEAGVPLHQRHDLFDDRRVLLVRGQVEHEIGAGDQLLEGAGDKAVARGVLPGGALVGDGLGPQGIGDVEPAVAHVEALVEPLGATADNHDFSAPQLADAIVELRAIHESAFAKLFQLKAQGQGVKVIHEVFQLQGFGFGKRGAMI